MGTWDAQIAEASRKFNIPEPYLRAVIQAESSGNPNAVSGAGAGGLFQVMPRTYAGLAPKLGLGPNLMDPSNNITAGAAYMRQLNDLYGGDWHKTMFGYNAGPGVVAQVEAGQRDYKPESKKYVDTVLAGFGQTPAPATPTPVPEIEVGPGRYSGSGGGLLSGSLQNTATNTATPAAPVQARSDVSGRIDALLKDLAMPVAEGPRLTSGQYKLAGMADAVTPLAAIRDRQVGLGELLGAAGGGLGRGTLAGQQASRDERANQFGELANMAKLQTYQRGEATAEAKVRAAQQLAFELRQSNDPRLHQLAAGLERDPTTIDEVMKAIAAQAYSTKQPKTVSTAEGVFILNDDGTLGARVGSPVPRGGAAAPPAPVTTADGVFARNADGTLGPRLGASETAPDSELPAQTPEQLRQIAIDKGLPLPGPSSLDNPALSPRGRGNLAAANAKTNEKRLAASDEAATGAQKIIGQMDRFTFLNQTNATNGFFGSPLVGAVRGMWDAEFKEMQAITAEIAPSLRQPGSGATSDYDARMFVAGTVSVDKPRETNLAIATAVRTAAQNLIAKADFDRQYAQTYRHLEGADLAWREYLNANPIFDPTAKGAYQLNPNRMDWQTYFRSKLGVTPTPKADQPTPAPGRAIPPPPPGAVVVPMPGGA